MATVVIEESASIDIETFDGAFPTSSSIGGGTAAGSETVTFYEGTTAISRKVTSATAGGYRVNLAANQNLTTSGNEVLMGKVFLSDGADLNTVGLKYRIDSGTAGNHYYLLVHSSNLVYPTTRSWLIVPWDTSLAEYRTLVGTAPTMTAISEIGVECGLATGGAKSQNLFLDAIQYGRELYYTRGDAGSTEGDWTYFLDYDEGGVGTGIASTSNRIGHAIAQEGVIYAAGGFVIGRTAAASTANPSEFIDNGNVVVFPNTATGTGWNFIECDLTNASTVIEFNSTVYLGRGVGAEIIFFDTGDQTAAGDVNATNDDIILITNGTLEVGTAVTITNTDRNGTAGGESPGVTTATQYWLGKAASPSTANSWTFHNSRLDAINSASAVALTASTAANAEEWRAVVDQDTRPDLTITGTGGSFDANASSFTNFNTITLTSASTLTGSSILGTSDVVQSSATITGCTFSGSTTEKGDALIDVNSLSDISNCTFEASDGHAMELNTSNGTSLTLSGTTFTGYPTGNNPTTTGGYTTSAYSWDTTANMTTTVITFGSAIYADGDAVVYEKGYEDTTKATANTDAIGLTAGNIYFVGAVSGAAFSLYDTYEHGIAGGTNGRVSLTVPGNNERHHLYPADAAIYNNSGKVITLSVTNGGTTPSVRDSATSITIVQNNVNIDVKVQDVATNAIEGARVYIYNATTSSEITNTTTNASGVITTASAPNGNSIYVRVRQSNTTDTTRYFPVETVATLAGNLSLTITLTEDTNV